MFRPQLPAYIKFGISKVHLGLGHRAKLTLQRIYKFCSGACALQLVGSAKGMCVPEEVCLLGGRLGQWMRMGLGVAPEDLPTSVK